MISLLTVILYGSVSVCLLLRVMYGNMKVVGMNGTLVCCFMRCGINMNNDIFKIRTFVLYPGSVNVSYLMAADKLNCIFNQRMQPVSTLN